MIEIPKLQKERAILVAVDTKDLNREIVEEHLSELEELSATAGADTIIKIIQDRYAFDPAEHGGINAAISIIHAKPENTANRIGKSATGLGYEAVPCLLCCHCPFVQVHHAVDFKFHWPPPIW